LDQPIGGVKDISAEELANVRLDVRSVIFEEASDLATWEEFDPIGGLGEPILHGYEEVGGLPNVLDKPGGGTGGDTEASELGRDLQITFAKLDNSASHAD